MKSRKTEFSRSSCQMAKEAYSMLKIWWSLVVLSPPIHLQSHHGALAVFAVPCQVTKRTNAVERSGVSHHNVTFQNTCTDRDVLVLVIRARCDIRAEEPDYSTNSFRKAAYRQYILGRYKKLGRGNRRVCPSCAVLTIRQLYPAEDGIYMGFKRA